MTIFFTTPHTDPRPVAIDYEPDNPPPCCWLHDLIRKAGSPLTAAALRAELMSGLPVPFAGGTLEWMET